MINAVKFMQMTHYQFCCCILNVPPDSNACIFASFQRIIKTNIRKESPSCILWLGVVSGKCEIIYAYIAIFKIGNGECGNGGIGECGNGGMREWENAGTGERGMGEREMGERGMGETGNGETENGGIGEQGLGEQETGERGMGEQGMGERGMGEQGIGERGMGERGNGEGYL
jgi:hypothetical protein